MKKMVCFFICFCMILFLYIPTSAIGMIQKTESNKEKLKDCIDISKSIAIEYLYSQQTCVSVELNYNFLFPTIKEYLKNKLAISHIIKDVAETNRFAEKLIGYNFKSNCVVTDCTISDYDIQINLFVTYSVLYPDSSEPTQAGIPVRVSFVFSGGKPYISDFCTNDYYDSSNESEKCCLSLTKWDRTANNNFVEDSFKELEQIKADTFLKLDELNKQSGVIKNNSEDLFSSINATRVPVYGDLYSFNRSYMVTYAKRTAKLYRSSDNKLYYNGVTARGSSQVPYYYDFSALSNSYDCTNFVSHVLLAGGAKIYNSGNASTGWYFFNVNSPGSSSRSYSWSGVDSLYNFLTQQYHSVGPVGTTSYSITNAEKGDIVQFKYSDYGGNGYGHSTIVTVAPFTDYTQYPGYSSPVTNIKITSRSGNPPSGNSSYYVDQNFYRKLLNLDSGNHVIGFRVIRLLGYAY